MLCAFREPFGDLFCRGWDDLPTLQRALDARAARLADRLKCPVTGTSVTEAHQVERFALQPLPELAEPFEVVVSRRVSRDCFEGRRYTTAARRYLHSAILIVNEVRVPTPGPPRGGPVLPARFRPTTRRARSS